MSVRSPIPRHRPRCVALAAALCALALALTACRASLASAPTFGNASDESAAPPAAPDQTLVPAAAPAAPPPAPPEFVVAALPQGARPRTSADDLRCAQPTPRPCCWTQHLVMGASIVPGLGAQVAFGGRLGGNARLETAWELGFAFQDQTASFNGEAGGGQLVLGSLGLRWRTRPQSQGLHLLGRAGLAVFDVTGRPRTITFDFVDIDDAGTHVGAFVGLGFDVDLGHGWSTGPEARLLAGYNLEAEEWSLTPLFAWNVTLAY